MSLKHVEETLEFIFINKFVKLKYPWVTNLSISEKSSNYPSEGKVTFHYLVDATISGVDFLKATDSKLLEEFFRLTEFEAGLCNFSTISCLTAEEIHDNIEFEMQKIVNNTHIPQKNDNKFRPSVQRNYILNDEFKVILPNINDIDDDLLE
jgi:hypothetical protein